MSQTATRMVLARAQQLAEAVRGELLPGCERIEVAGSVRRHAPYINDIELVAITKKGSRPVKQAGLFSDAVFATVSELERITDRLMMEDRIVRHKNGGKFKQFTLRKPGVKVDLFICTAETWAVTMMIRTGPEAFSKRFVTQKAKGGLLPDNMRIGDGSSAGTNRLYVDGAAVELADERELFRAVGMKWVEPWERR